MIETPAQKLEARLRAAGGRALVAYLPAGHPDVERFPSALRAVASVADVVEVGVPFTDPMADGVTIQRASAAALSAGVTLRGLLEMLASLEPPLAAPVVLMSYLNPLLVLDDLGAALAAAGVSGLIVPDLPLEERAPFATNLEANGLALIPMLAPNTPPERIDAICRDARGFVYAVTSTGVTGGDAALPAATFEQLARARAASPVPVLAGFGIRSAAQARALHGHADGVIVGSALVLALSAGEDPANFLRSLRETEK